MDLVQVMVSAANADEQDPRERLESLRDALRCDGADADVCQQVAEQALEAASRLGYGLPGVLVACAADVIPWPEYGHGDGYWAGASDLAVWLTHAGLTESGPSVLAACLGLPSQELKFVALGVVASRLSRAPEVLDAVGRFPTDPIVVVAATNPVVAGEDVVRLMGKCDDAQWWFAAVNGDDGWTWPEFQDAFGVASRARGVHPEFWRQILASRGGSSSSVTGDAAAGLWVDEFVDEYLCPALEEAEGVDESEWPPAVTSLIRAARDDEALAAQVYEGDWEELVRLLGGAQGHPVDGSVHSESAGRPPAVEASASQADSGQFHVAFVDPMGGTEMFWVTDLRDEGGGNYSGVVDALTWNCPFTLGDKVLLQRDPGGVLQATFLLQRSQFATYRVTMYAMGPGIHGVPLEGIEDLFRVLHAATARLDCHIHPVFEGPLYDSDEDYFYATFAVRPTGDFEQRLADVADVESAIQQEIASQATQSISELPIAGDIVDRRVAPILQVQAIWLPGDRVGPVDSLWE
jgi:hypothetical protein